MLINLTDQAAHAKLFSRGFNDYGDKEKQRAQASLTPRRVGQHEKHHALRQPILSDRHAQMLMLEPKQQQRLKNQHGMGLNANSSAIPYQTAVSRARPIAFFAGFATAIIRLAHGIARYKPRHGFQGVVTHVMFNTLAIEAGCCGRNAKCQQKVFHNQMTALAGFSHAPALIRQENGAIGFLRHQASVLQALQHFDHRCVCYAKSKGDVIAARFLFFVNQFGNQLDIVLAQLHRMVFAGAAEGCRLQLAAVLDLALQLGFIGPFHDLRISPLQKVKPMLKLSLAMAKLS
jgi:hypothetical protein